MMFECVYEWKRECDIDTWYITTYRNGTKKSEILLNWREKNWYSDSISMCIVYTHNSVTSCVCSRYFFCHCSLSSLDLRHRSFSLRSVVFIQPPLCLCGWFRFITFLFSLSIDSYHFFNLLTCRFSLDYHPIRENIPIDFFVLLEIISIGRSKWRE